MTKIVSEGQTLSREKIILFPTQVFKFKNFPRKGELFQNLITFPKVYYVINYDGQGSLKFMAACPLPTQPRFISTWGIMVEIMSLVNYFLWEINIKGLFFLKLKSGTYENQVLFYNGEFHVKNLNWKIQHQRCVIFKLNFLWVWSDFLPTLWARVRGWWRFPQEII